ncbi:MAG: serpin family protein [Haloechinothrix sp.]
MADRSSAQWQHLKFALAVQRVVASGNESSCFSPYSVASALGMACQAARGDTADELRALLAPGDPDIAKQVDLLRGAAELDAERTGEDPVLAVSNTLWAWDELALNEGFLTDLAGWPGAKVRGAPFRTDPEGARRAINADVAETTHQLIEELVPSGAVHEDTVASLVNALYLKAAWRNRFADQDTAEEQFHTPAGSRAVPMMRQVEQLGYAAAGGWQAVTLPAAGGVEAVVLLPDTDLPEAEAALDADLLDDVLACVRKRQVDLHLPRLDLTMSADLVDALRKLGVQLLFTRAADLGGLTEDARLCVDGVLHKSVLKLDEQGLEGAAATAVMMRLTSMPSDAPIEVRVDRPFLLLIRHAVTCAVYFLARVSDPG